VSASEVLLSDEALYQLASIPSNDDYHRVMRALQALATFPLMGKAYEPLNQAPAPPAGTRVLYAGHYGVYHLHEHDETTDEVRVLSISDQRRNPRERFIFTEPR